MDNRLSAIVLHDVKNALGELEGRLESLSRSPDRLAAEEAHHSCVALRERLIAFLTLYKASTLGLRANIDAVPVEDFLHGLARRHSADMPGLSVSPSLPELGFYDEHLVELALEAALQNARRFARSAIEIACFAQDNGMTFTIKDDGTGLGTAEETPSTGLGTELCKAIAEAHCRDGRRGRVSLRNHPDGGAVFELWLP